MSEDDILKDFLVESYENLDRLDRDLVGLERNPHDLAALSGVFRTIHTIKGTCGFLGFTKLEKVAHVGENLLTRMRDGQLTLNPERTTALLGMVDAVRQMLAEIESSGQDGKNDYPELRETLTQQQTPVVGDAGHVPATTVTQPPSVVEAVAPRVTEPPAIPPVRHKIPTPKEAAPQIQAKSPAAPAQHPPDTKQPDTKQRDASAETIRVGVNLLDELMTLVGELVLARNQLLQSSNRLKDAGLQTVSQRMNLIATELQEEVMKTRMQPIGNIWRQFPRTVRDVAHGCGKEVTIEMEGKETELDKTIIEAIKDPLTHLVRNSVDHGIELPEVRQQIGKPRAGNLILRAFHEGGQVNIEISDDGAGLDAEKIRNKALERNLITADQAAHMTEREAFHLIFLPGFSTAAKVTNVSGRGVGMDVVKTNVEKIGGIVDLQSTLGEGTTIRLKIPLTLAIIPALVVTCNGDRYAIPQVNLLELVRLEAEKAGTAIEMVHGVRVYRLRGRLLPLVYLSRELKLAEMGLKSTASIDEAVNIVVLQADDRQFGLVVDGINDTEEIVVKPLRKQLKNIKTFAGSSIMGDGKVALILDVLGLAQRANVVGEIREKGAIEKAADAANDASAKQTFLLFAGVGDSRMAIPLNTLTRLEEFPISQVETSGNQWVTQYRGQILSLVRLSVVMQERRKKLRSTNATPRADSGLIQVLVLNHEGRIFGLVVDKILDIVEDRAEVKSPASRAYVLYSVVIGERITELLDIRAILKTTAPPTVVAVEPAAISAGKGA
jgi:two-component system chemotaxis sensor kinase CheA